MDVSGLIYLVCHLVSLRGRLNTLVLNHFQHPPTERNQTDGQERGRASSRGAVSQARSVGWLIKISVRRDFQMLRDKDLVFQPRLKQISWEGSGPLST